MANAAARRFYAAAGFAEVLCHLSDDQGRPHPLIRLLHAAGALSAPATHMAA